MIRVDRHLHSAHDFDCCSNALERHSIASDMLVSMSQKQRGEESRQQVVGAASRRETKQRLLDAAVSEFESHGYTATPVSRIAATAGVTVQTLYLAWGSKRALLRAYLSPRSPTARMPQGTSPQDSWIKAPNTSSPNSQRFSSRLRADPPPAGNSIERPRSRTARSQPIGQNCSHCAERPIEASLGSSEKLLFGQGSPRRQQPLQHGRSPAPRLSSSSCANTTTPPRNTSSG